MSHLGNGGRAVWQPGFVNRVRRRIALWIRPPVSADDAGIPWIVHPGPRYYTDSDGQPVTPEGVIATHVPGGLPGRRYHHDLPPMLAAWYVYTAAGGHQIAVHPAGIRAPAHDPAAFLVLVPVLTVLRSRWRADNGVIVCDVPFDRGPAYSLADLEF